ncbi:MAG: hypothetical protein HRU40_09645 [Saprospiraceae bacterium]|nr:hypothetical protein [Saprospiraceae bacterium]
MSWDIVLFNSKEKIESIEELDEDKLVPIDFADILENSFDEMVKDENHRRIKGINFFIDFFTDDEPVSNKILSLHGENGLFELIEISKQNGWQIFDTGLGSMIDLDNPENNGFANHTNYVSNILNKMKE